MLAGGHHKKINSECIEHMILQGFSPCKDVLEIEDDPQKFADKVCDLLNDKKFRKKIKIKKTPIFQFDFIRKNVIILL